MRKTVFKKVYLDSLPHKGARIDWINSVGKIVKFEYDNLIGEVEIISYCENNILIKYLNNEPYKISMSNFKNGMIGVLLGIISEEFKYEINQKLKSKHRDITIIDRKYIPNNKNQKVKFYLYQCNICHYEGWVSEYQINKNKKCACCTNQSVVEGINDIPTTAPWMIPYFQGGYDEAKLYTKCSGHKIIPVCPDCGRIKDKPIIISSLNSNFSIGCSCSDGISYPEKFIINLLNQTNLNYTYQLSKKNVNWISSNIKYDFAILDNSCIIESHGLQHYLDRTSYKSYWKRTLEEEQENDKYKEQLAIENSIEHYIVLDCRKSELEWIKKSVMDSELPTLLNFTENDINWLECHEFACSNLSKEVISLWNKGLSIYNITNIIKIDRHTVSKYLKQGNSISLCEYNTKLANDRSKNIKKNKITQSISTPIKCIETNQVFQGISICENFSICALGVSINGKNMSRQIKNNYQQNGYTFKYITREEFNNIKSQSPELAFGDFFI
ncbi:MAG: hypothetical protein K0R54_5130 [Clostridiaceae bacterium]|jgi:hypothetical protein|nr:hypothetical protein [Clostridiaceae bacterium]